MTANDSVRPRLGFFDRTGQFSIVNRHLPHWSQAGVLCFLTWRTIDSIPSSIAERWQADRLAWLRSNGALGSAGNWREQLHSLAPYLQTDYHRRFSRDWLGHLDECHGSCVLRNAECAEIVAKSLLHFDGVRYALTDFVVMPNHVHILATFKNEEGMLTQCESWKHFTAAQINKRLGSKGRFWQKDVFDHLVRSEKSFLRFRSYIRENPLKAGLREGEYLHYSAKITEEGLAKAVEQAK